MLGFAVALFLLATVVGLLQVLPMVGLYKGCGACRQLMLRTATRCPHCHTWVADAPVAR